MIKVIIKYLDNKFKYLNVSGHAQSAPKGKDLVCAGVSAIVVGGLNNLNHSDYDITVTEGYVELTSKNEITSHDEIVIQTMLTQLETIAESYPKNIKIIK